MSKATFEIYIDREGKWRWRLVHDNGNIIADSGEGYASRQKCEQGLRSVQQNAPGADVERVDNPTGGG
ncbi:MAG: HVO_2922 family protein [Halobacteriota archaeon]